MADNLLLPISLDRLVDTNGTPLSGAKVHVYDAGTTNAKTIYTDNALSVAAANPIVADAGGYIAARFVGTGDYKLVITDADDVTIKTQDNLTGALDTSGFANDEATPVTPAITKSSNYTVQASDKGDVILADATGGTFTVTLLSAATAGDGFRITIKNIGSANSVTVATGGGDTLDGASSFSLVGQYETITCTSDGANWHISDDGQIFTAPLPVGVVLPYGGSTAPTGWALCYGQELSRTGFASLFGVIGTTFGSGDGSTTFEVPDMRGRVPAGQDDMGGASANRLTGQTGGVDGDVLGSAGGSETHALTEAQLAAHTHGPGNYGTNNEGSHTHGTGDGTQNRFPITSTEGTAIASNGSFARAFSASNSIDFTTSTGSGSNHNHSVTSGVSGSTGSDTAHNNVQPTIILNYIIKAT